MIGKSIGRTATLVRNYKGGSFCISIDNPLI